MMWSPKLAVADSDARVTPEELNAEIGSVLSQFNGGLDRENIPINTINASYVGARGEYSKFWTMQATVTGGVNRTSTVDEYTVPNVWEPIPGDTGAAMRTTITCPREGDLHICAGGSVEHLTGTQRPLVNLAIQVDGVLIAKCGDCSRVNTQTWQLDARVPVTAGEHIITLVWHYSDKIALGTTYDLEWHETQTLIRWVGV